MHENEITCQDKISLNISLEVHLWYINFLSSTQFSEGVECSEEAAHYHKSINPVPKRSEEHRPVALEKLKIYLIILTLKYTFDLTYMG
jgi:hypothetical protein